MRGFTTSFPRGGAGAGLLLLRAAVALQLLLEAFAAGAPCWWPMATPASWPLVQLAAALAIPLAILLAVLLALGMLTPVAGAISAVFQLSCLGSAGWAQAPPYIIAAATATALVLLGPGAYSADARLFGRRRLVLPASAADHRF